MGDTFRYGSSLRARSLEQTLELARGLAPDLGIVRVTDTTRLDRVGVPVYASIRPSAAPGSLCVSAGKGMVAAEAQAGAYMEAIELAWAEPQRARVETTVATPRDLLDGRSRPEAAYDFGTVDGQRLDMGARIDCAVAACVTTGASELVPAELVLFPAPRTPGCTSLIGGCHGNGLCSGNTVDEATVHGLGELIERDVMAFNNSRDDSRLIRNDTLPAPLREIAERLESSGFRLFVRHQPNEFNLPWIMATIWEPGLDAAVHTGYGCSPSRSIAATRAIVEAAQGRLTVIHGGRDDLPIHYKVLAPLSPRDRQRTFQRIVDRFASDEHVDAFDDLVDRSNEASDIDTSLETLRRALDGAGFAKILRAVYTPPDYPIQVVRVIVPGLEIATGGIRQVGRRLKEFRDSLGKVRGPVRGTDAGDR